MDGPATESYISYSFVWQSLSLTTIVNILEGKNCTTNRRTTLKARNQQYLVNHKGWLIPQ